MSNDTAAQQLGRLRTLLDGTARFERNYATGPPAWQGEAGSAAASELAEAASISSSWSERLVEFMGWPSDAWEGWRDHIVTVLDEVRPPIESYS